MSYWVSKYIYSIVNTANNKRYIGQTSNYIRRWKNHLFELRARKHNNLSLQKDFNRYGESVFVFELLEIRHRRKERADEDREFTWMKHFKTYTSACGYNENDSKSIAYLRKLNSENQK